MSETKSKKIRIYKLASEYNLSADGLVEFLQKKGYDQVKSIQSLVTDEMIVDINDFFKKDIEKAEKHYKKIAEFNKMREVRSEEKKEEKIEEKAAPVVEEEKIEVPAAEEEFEEEEYGEEEESDSIEEILEEIPIAVELSDDSIEVKDIEVTEDIKEEKAAVVETEPEPETGGLGAVEDDLPPSDPVEEKKFTSPKDLEVLKKKGLTVVGKIDLNERKRRPPRGEFRDQREQKDPRAKAPGAQQTPTQDKPIVKPVSETDPLKKKKKKKKKILPTATAAPAPTEPVEETSATKRKKKVKKFEIDQKDVKAAIRKTLMSMDDSIAAGRASAKKKKRREREAEEERKSEAKALSLTKIGVTEFISVNELANLMSVQVGDVISKCIELGLMVSINQRLDVETITLVADEFGFEIELQQEYTSEALEDTPDRIEDLSPRSPVVTIMGHVDHGKTSLLDYIRRTNVVAGESGGITQHIGAYKVDVGEGRNITFLDTPGHEAFTAMRARGAQLTDIVVLVVAADDAVMPQTVEAINHAQAANVPILIAINKIDKPGANPDKIKQQMADRNILVEEWGGKHQCVEISAKGGVNIDGLLEKILLEAEILDLKANADRYARGAVVESELDKGRGITATVLVQKGTLKVGDPFVAGIYQGKVRAMFDERGNKVNEAGPCTPVLVLGFEGAPQAGDVFVVVESERTAREVGIKRQQLKREQDQKQIHHLTLEEIGKQISIGGVKELPLIVKGDVDGSVEALSDSLMKLSNEEVIVRVIHKGVGAISESDVLLAAASNAIIIGFHVRPNLNARKTAETQNVDVRLYSVIYDAINEVKSALEGLLSPVISEEITGSAEIRDTFKVPKSGTVAGCYVLDGKISRNSKVRLIRDGIVIHDGEIGSLRRFKDDAKEVDAGYECGLNLANYNDIRIGDILETYKLVETKKKLT